MKRLDMLEASGIVTRMINNLVGIQRGSNAGGTTGTEATRQAGYLLANLTVLITGGTVQGSNFSTYLLGCFDAVQADDATVNGFETLRKSILAENPISTIAIAMRDVGVRFCLVEEVNILAQTTFESRDDADKMISLMNSAFTDAEDTAASQLDNVVYQALVTAHGACIRDLVQRSLLLPQVINVSLGDSFPSLYLANRLYQDPTRTQQLISDNKVVHPAFMPANLVALSD